MSTTALKVPCPAGCDPATTHPFVGELAGHLVEHHAMDRGPAVAKAREVFTTASIGAAIQPFPADVPTPDVPAPGLPSNGLDPEEPAMKAKACCGSKGQRHLRDCKGAKPPPPPKVVTGAVLPAAKNGQSPKPAKKSVDPVTAAIDARLADERAKRAAINGRITALEQARDLLRYECGGARVSEYAILFLITSFAWIWASERITALEKRVRELEEPQPNPAGALPSGRPA